MKLMQTSVDEQPQDGKQVIRSRPIHSIQNNIQTLRAIAIWFVLLFHMWPTRFKHGYLGVDIFFVISGYLMCLILSRKRPITFPVCVEFYYRRVKRIVPLYFTVILVVLMALRHVISPIEFTQLYEEAVPALGFYSNIPNMREAAYFDIVSCVLKPPVDTSIAVLEALLLFAQLELSVELQFYLIVPLIFAFFDRIEKLRLSLKFSLITIIPITSFVFQCYASKDFAHMLLPARIWQFFVGFGAFYLREQRFLDLSKEDANKWIDSVKIVVVHGVLIPLLVVSLPILPQLQRLLVVLLTGVVVGSHCETFVLSNLRPIITLGDISYSVYLIHWPLFTWHKYAHSVNYTDGGEPNIATGLLLIAISIGLGYVVENAFKWLMKRVSGWSALTLVLAILLCLNGIQLHNLRQSAVDLDAGMSTDKPLDEAKQKIRHNIEMLWSTRANPSNFTKEEVTKYNTEQLQAASVYCNNNNRSMPTNYPLNMSSYTQTEVYTCHAEGNGSKNIVIIGNSHAYHNWAGIAHIFRQTYKRLTLFGRSGCRPMPLRFQRANMTVTALVQRDYNECLDLFNATIPALRAWRKPIDLIISLYATINHPHFPIPNNIEKDELYQILKTFYVKISEIPREALIIMESCPFFPQIPIREVESRMKTGNPLNTIGDKPDYSRQLAWSVRKRMEHIQCPKCLKLDLLSFWCNRTHDNFCHSTTPQGVVYFTDEHHPGGLGSFYNADLIYQLYQKFVA